MTVHPEIARILATLPEPDGSPLDPVAMRAGEAAGVPPLAERQPPIASVTDADADGVPVRVYQTRADAPGVLVYFHGGAFFLGSLDTHDHVARALAKETGWTVISVGFRLAPEHAFPAGLEDCWTATQWAVRAFPGVPLAVAGDSSGGTFAAAIAGRAVDEGLDALTHQVLFYPSLDLDFDETRYESLVTNATGYGLETRGLKPFNAFYVNSGANPDDPRVSPMKRADLSGLPPALIITAEFDPLRDEGELYGRRLRAAGVDATVSRYAGANHGFVQNFAWIPEFQRVFGEVAAFLNRR